MNTNETQQKHERRPPMSAAVEELGGGALHSIMLDTRPEFADFATSEKPFGSQ